MQQLEHWRRLLLRTEETADYYEKVQKDMSKTEGCRLCSDTESIVEYKHWRLMPNRFPYDRYFSKSAMLVSRRHVDETDLNEDEKSELFKLKQSSLTDEYDMIFENLPKQKSIPHHMHYHLAKIKRPE